jgi:hypothetical protein
MTPIDISKYMVGDAKTEHWQPIKHWLIDNIGRLKTIHIQTAYGDGWTVKRYDVRNAAGDIRTSYFVEIEDDSLAVMFKLIWS